MSGRRFSDEEVAELIRRAQELQERAGSSHALTSAEGRGLTLDEVKHVAREVGIEPRFVEAVATTQSLSEERGGARGFLGGETHWRFERTIAGELPTDERGRLIEAIRAVFTAKGEVEDVYGRMEWSHDDGLGPVIVGVVSRDGRTEIDVGARRGGEAGLIHGLMVPFGGIGGGAALAGLLGLSGAAEVLPAIGVALGLSWVVTRTWWRYASRAWERKLRDVTGRITDAAATVVRLPPGGAPDDPADSEPGGDGA